MSKDFIGRRIKLYRLKAGYSQSEFAKKIGISQGTLSDIEASKTLPSIKTIVSIVKNFRELNCDWLLTGKRGPSTARYPLPSGQEERIVRKVVQILNSRNRDAISRLNTTINRLLKGLKKR